MSVPFGAPLPNMRSSHRTRRFKRPIQDAPASDSDSDSESNANSERQVLASSRQQVEDTVARARINYHENRTQRIQELMRKNMTFIKSCLSQNQMLSSVSPLTRAETGGSKHVIRQSVNSQSCFSFDDVVSFESSIPPGTAYITLDLNYNKGDQKKLRYVPYFGEHDDLILDETVYDVSEDSEENLSESEDFTLWEAVNEHGRDSKTLSMIAAAIPAPKQAVKDRVNEVPPSMPRLRPLISGIDIDNMDQLLDSYESLFCHRCYIYNCRQHGVDQPRRIERRLPAHSLMLKDSLKYLLRFQATQIAENNPFPNGAPSVSSKKSPCGPSCSLNITPPATPESHEFSEAEAALFLKLVLVCERNFCSIAQCMGSRSCAEVAFHANTMGVPDARIVPVLLAGPEDKIAEFKRRNKKKARSIIGRTVRARSSNGRTVRRDVNALHEFEPCDHPGPCVDPATCSCLRSNNHCEKFCACASTCRRLFSGCQCRKRQCRTRACPCFAASRECDPDSCSSCQSVHRDTSEGVCENVNLRYRQGTRHLIIGRSALHGWGAFSPKPIGKGDFVTEYLGEVISQDEADRRGRIYDKKECSYLFNLNEEFVIDAQAKGNKMKFVNHSDQPNLEARVMLVNGDHRIGVYAMKDIRPYEELSFHYHHKSGSNDVNEPSWFQNPNSF